MSKPFKSFAQWPSGTLHDGVDISDDGHDTREQADAVCQHLERRGLGGDRKVFPVKTWVEEAATARNTMTFEEFKAEFDASLALMDEADVIIALKAAVIGWGHEAASLKTLTEDCAETDADIKAICKKHGISDEWPDDFKPAVECVKELAEKLDAVAKKRDAAIVLLEEKDVEIASLKARLMNLHIVEAWMVGSGPKPFNIMNAFQALVAKLDAADYSFGCSNLDPSEWQTELAAAKEALK